MDVGDDPQCCDRDVGQGRGGARAPIRAALIHFWGRDGGLRQTVPLIGAAALRAETPPEPAPMAIDLLAVPLL